MSYLDVSSGQVVAQASENERARFMRNTYLHVAGAIAAFAVIEALLLQLGLGEVMLAFMGMTSFSWLIVLGAFMGVSMLANNWAHSSASRELQYAGLALFVVAEAVIFLPLIYMALRVAPDALPSAALVTAALVAGITFTAFSSKINFSFLGRILSVGFFVAMGLIVASIVFGFSLGIVFTGVMIIFAGASVLYSTSNIIHEYHTEQHVAAALSLFSSVALLFWYVLQFIMSMAGND